MPGLGETVAAIAARRRRGPPAARAAGGRLKPVTGFGANPGRLRMLAYAPPGLAPGAPLVVVLHGCTQSAAAYAEGAGWLTLADRHGFAVVAPEQISANNPNLCFNWFEPGHTTRGAGEAASIREMAAHAASLFGSDPARIFVTGLSAGGAMTAAMLATYPEVFAAGAIVAGLPYGAASNVQEAFGAMFQGRSRPAREWGDTVRAASSHAGPWPRLTIWHGDADTTVKPGAAEELARQWTDLHGLEGLPTTAASPTGRRHLVWRSEAGDPLVELHRLPGLGHGTPLHTGDGVGEAGPFLLEAGVSSSQEIAHFWGIAGEAAAAPEAGAPESAAPSPEPAVTEGPADPLPPAALPRYIPPAHAPHKLTGLRTAARGPAVDVGAVITTALRNAGLMK